MEFLWTFAIARSFDAEIDLLVEPFAAADGSATFRDAAAFRDADEPGSGSRDGATFVDSSSRTDCASGAGSSFTPFSVVVSSVPLSPSPHTLSYEHVWLIL